MASLLPSTAAVGDQISPAWSAVHRAPNTWYLYVAIGDSDNSSSEDIAARFVEQPAVIGEQEVVSIKFVDGMIAAQHELHDPDPETWEAAYQH
jgi:hypothetical protein